MISVKKALFLLCSLIALTVKIEAQGGGCNVCEQKTALRRSRGEAEPLCKFETGGVDPQATLTSPFEVKLTNRPSFVDLKLRSKRIQDEFKDFLIFFHKPGTIFVATQKKSPNFDFFRERGDGREYPHLRYEHGLGPRP